MNHSEVSDPPAAPLRSASGYDITPLDRATVEALASALTDEERRVMLHEGTEPPFCGGLLSNKEDGVYSCRLCGLPLFASAAKFESGTGWPSFYQPVDEDHVRELRDTSHGMVRVEIRCARCDGHLGHVFEDGPRPTGRRHCLNSAALEFTEEGASLPQKLAAGA
jgi:peptide-methionine (R)-S-oxide reductase